MFKRVLLAVLGILVIATAFSANPAPASAASPTLYAGKAVVSFPATGVTYTFPAKAAISTTGSIITSALVGTPGPSGTPGQFYMTTAAIGGHWVTVSALPNMSTFNLTVGGSLLDGGVTRPGDLTATALSAGTTARVVTYLTAPAVRNVLIQVSGTANGVPFSVTFSGVAP